MGEGVLGGEEVFMELVGATVGEWVGGEEGVVGATVGEGAVGGEELTMGLLVTGGEGMVGMTVGET